MKKFMILIAAMAMTTLFAQANMEKPASTIALETEAPAPTNGDANGTTEEATPEGK